MALHLMAQPPTAQTCHRFPDFPWEIRDRIWEEAIRPDRPGAHVPQVSSHGDYLPWLTNKTSGSEPGDVAVTPSHARAYDRLRLSLPTSYPQCHSPQSLEQMAVRGNRASPPLKNPSTYLVDTGLWTACKESRVVIQRSFDRRLQATLPEERQENTEPLGDEEPVGSPTRKKRATLATGYFLPNRYSKDSPHLFAIFPQSDLIIFQPTEQKNLDALHQWFWNGFGQYLGSQGVHNVALEYDPAWDIPRYSDRVIKNLGLSLLTMGVKDTLWIIDRTLKREGPVSRFFDEDGQYFEVDSRYLWDIGPRAASPNNFFNTMVIGFRAAWRPSLVAVDREAPLPKIGLLGYERW